MQRLNHGPAKPLTSGMVIRQLLSGNHALPAFYAQLAGSGPFPAAVIHEIFGLRDDLRSVAERFAAVGYEAPAVDLPRKKQGANYGRSALRFAGVPRCP